MVTLAGKLRNIGRVNYDYREERVSNFLIDGTSKPGVVIIVGEAETFQQGITRSSPESRDARLLLRK